MQNELCITRPLVTDDFVITPDDDFEIITMYPRPVIDNCNPPAPRSNVSSSMLPYSLTPNVSYPMRNDPPMYPTISAMPASTQSTITRESCHPLQGIPFKLAPALELSQNLQLDPVLEDVKRTLERVKNLLESETFNYDCTLERNFLREVEQK